MERLYHFVARLYAVTDVEELEKLALHAAMDAVDAEAGSLILADSLGRLCFAQAFGPASESIKSLTFSPQEGVAGSVFKSGIPKIENDATTSNIHLHKVDDITGFATVNLLTVPLRVRGGAPIGVLQLVNKRTGKFDEEDLDNAELIGSFIALTLHNARLAAESKLAAVAHIAGEVSHDIGNLLTHVLPYVQSLQFMIDDVREGKPNAVDGLVSFYEEVLVSVEQGVTQVMTLTREMAAAVHGEVTPVELKIGKPIDVLYKVKDSLKTPLRTKNVNMEVTGDENLETRHDPHRLRTAIYNAANNALSATPIGGTIVLSVEDDHDPDYYRIVIADNGAGMTAEQAQRLFSDSNRSTKEGGTGLGARIVRRVAEQHGGYPSVDSSPDCGTRITLCLPK